MLLTDGLRRLKNLKEKAMFKIGQKVVCVKNSDDGKLFKDNIYVVEDIFEPVVTEYGIKVFGVSSPHYTGAYRASNFRPLDETFTHETIAMLNEHFKTVETEIMQPL